VFHRRDLGRVVAALRGAHPYEEPAFDLVPLVPVPGDPRLGAGRVATLPAAKLAAEIAESVRPALGGGVIARTRGSARRHECFAVCAGSGASLLEKAAAAGATLLVTGELSHHDVLRAHELGLELLLAGHTNTERGYLPRLAALLSAHAEAAGVEFRISVADVDPLS